MNLFSKSSNIDAAATGAKRDVTISNEPRTKRPDHVRVETDAVTWKIGLTLDEQRDLGSAYEWNERNGEFDKHFRDEESFLEMFTNRLYQSCAETITLVIKPCEPGKVHIDVESSNSNFTSEINSPRPVVSYDEVGTLILKWIEVSQSRKELIADLVTSSRGGDA
ncbi:hypothetical protein [Paraburkholderia sp. BL21I4N1]|uniref:hypothetical protein n=1 Tax=Paraburkholderia sp. BL21I4N1 TaxID=1938801 RepID=UPI000CFDC1E2|nr:hypothetical protein [Paraburkholderia sp. BL21I4N1]PQV52923.1 hypothetical protein B0G83_1023 [Paraburkholderia sp. BL21I4N1]